MLRSQVIDAPSVDRLTQVLVNLIVRFLHFLFVTEAESTMDQYTHTDGSKLMQVQYMDRISIIKKLCLRFDMEN